MSMRVVLDAYLLGPAIFGLLDRRFAPDRWIERSSIDASVWFVPFDEDLPVGVLGAHRGRHHRRVAPRTHASPAAIGDRSEQVFGKQNWKQHPADSQQHPATSRGTAGPY